MCLYLRVGVVVLVIHMSAGLGMAQTKQTGFMFKDAGDDAGLFPHLAGIRGHGAAWGDIDGSGFPALFVNSFHDNGSKAAMLFRPSPLAPLPKGEGKLAVKFTLDDQEHLRTSGAGSGALFVDLTNNGRLDLYVSNCAIDNKMALRKIPSALFRNDGGGKFTDVSKDSGAIFPLYAGRGLAALDYDGDGLLDLILCERYYGPVKYGPSLLKNKGNHQFENVSREAGLPEKLSGLAVAVGDVNNDGWPDIFLTEGDGDHRLLLNDKKGKFVDAPGSREIFRWKVPKDNTPTGVHIADINRDGLPDIVIGHHPDRPWNSPMAIRLYINKDIKDGVPTFEDVTQKAGLFALTMKAPHVEIQDFDNDGWPDIYVSIVKFKDKVPHPIIFKNLGLPSPPGRGAGGEGGIPKFTCDAWDINDWPTKDDLAVKKTGAFFEKLIKDRKIIYMAPGPTADFDRDGRLDMLLPNWWIEDRSLLLRNETPGGNWLDVQVQGTNGVNRMGIGSVVKIYPTGQQGDSSVLLGCREIAIGYGYCSGQEAVAHFGLGAIARVNVHVTLPHGKGTITQNNVAPNQRITLKQP